MKADAILKGDEGMWPLNLVPKDRLKKLHGITVDDEWLTKVQHSCVRMNNGGSASFVSSEGLIVTNHHVAADILYELSSKGKDYLREGYTAHTRAQELKAPQLEVNVLWNIVDVTEEVERALTTTASLKERAEKLRAVLSSIEKKSLEETGMRSDVVTLYNGGLYHLYQYKKYTDVRLVFAPENSIASYGGDIDNYEFPRYSLDATFLRVYENNKPLKSPNFFTWSTKAPKTGQVTFIGGHPGSTDRLTTYDRILMLRDDILPKVMQQIYRQEVLLQQFSGQSPEHARRALDSLHSIQNIRKRYMGQLESLQSLSFVEALKKKETAIRTAVAQNPALKKTVGKAWDEIRSAYQLHMTHRDEFVIFEGASGFRCEYFTLARMIVRYVEEQKKPNAKRLAEYGEARNSSLLDRLYSPSPIYSDLEEYQFKNALAYLVQTIGFNDKDVLTILNGKTIAQVAREYVGKTKLATVSERKKLIAGGSTAVMSSKDPFIQLALLVDKRARAVRTLIEVNVDTVIKDANSRISRAQFALYGNAMYPDATFTLRLTYGTTSKFVSKNVPEPLYTTIGGVFAHGDLHEQEGPWKLPASWEKNKTTLRKDKSAFNFVTTHDTHGGNSGSPVFTKDLVITGLLFDGISHTQGAETFLYVDDSKELTVCVHTQGILSVLKSVYKAKELVKELEKNQK